MHSFGIAVNVHTTQNAGGEIRGQVVFTDALTVGGTALLSGGNQVPANPSGGSGSSQVLVSSDGTYGVAFVGLSGSLSGPVAAMHIHGPADRVSSGPVLVTLPPQACAYYVFPISGWKASLTGGMTYVNVHTARCVV